MTKGSAKPLFTLDTTYHQQAKGNLPIYSHPCSRDALKGGGQSISACRGRIFLESEGPAAGMTIGD